MCSGLENRKAHGDIAFDFISDCDDCALGNIVVGRCDLLHLAGGQSVPGHIDDVIDAGHDVHVAFAVDEPSVASEIVPLVGGKVGVYVALVILPQRRGCSGRERELSNDFTKLKSLVFETLVKKGRKQTSSGRAM